MREVVSRRRRIIDATRANFGPIGVDVIGREAFIRNKRATGGVKDLGDVEALAE